MILTSLDTTNFQTKKDLISLIVRKLSTHQYMSLRSSMLEVITYQPLRAETIAITR